MEKVRFIYSKSKEAKYISHSDLPKVFEKIFKRAGISISYSKSSSAKPEISFASQLPITFESIGEIVEVIINEKYPIAFLIREVNKVVPSGITILSAEYVELAGADIIYKVYGSIYEIECIHEDKVFIDKNPKQVEEIKKWYKEKMNEYLSQEYILVLKKSKDRMERIDIKPQILGFTFSLDSNLQVTVSTGLKDNLNPDYIMAGFDEYINQELDYNVKRIKILY